MLDQEPDLSNKKPCMDYFHRGDSVVTLYKGRAATMSTVSYLAGNRIADF